MGLGGGCSAGGWGAGRAVGGGEEDGDDEHREELEGHAADEGEGHGQHDVGAERKSGTGPVLWAQYKITKNSFVRSKSWR